MLRLKQLWKDKKKLSDYIKELNPKKILLPFGHGLGDTIMFANPFKALCEKYPDIEFTLVMQKGLGFEELKNDIEQPNGKVLFSSDLSYNNDIPEYDIIADIDFPMNEGQTELTKGEWCCKHEFGIKLINGHKQLTVGKNRLIGIHFQITCLPDAANPDQETAEKVWNDVLSEGFIPIEMHLQHVFHNPVNKMFPFIDCTVRRVRPQVSTLLGLIQSCAGVICVVSGNLHAALSLLPPERIFFLEKHFKLACFTKKQGISQASILPGKYNGEVKQWLQKIESLK